MGDMPIYVSLDSADVWAHPELFELDEQRRPTGGLGRSAGLLLAKPGSSGATRSTAGSRSRRTATPGGSRASARTCGCATSCASTTSAPSRPTGRCPRSETTALRTEPGCRARARSSSTPCARSSEEAAADRRRGPRRHHRRTSAACSTELGVPGMKVLQFAFYEADSEYLPHRHAANAVVYTGTHDNDTATGWYANLEARGAGARVRLPRLRRGAEIRLGPDPRRLRLGRRAGRSCRCRTCSVSGARPA